MLIIVPKDIGGLEEIEKNLDKVQIDYDELSYAPEKVQLYLPKFKVESTIDLNLHLNDVMISLKLKYPCIHLVIRKLQFLFFTFYFLHFCSWA